MAKVVATTGNSAIAYAMKQINPDVCAAYRSLPPPRSWRVLEVRGRRRRKHQPCRRRERAQRMSAAWAPRRGRTGHHATSANGMP